MGAVERPIGCRLLNWIWVKQYPAHWGALINHSDPPQKQIWYVQAPTNYMKVKF